MTSAELRRVVKAMTSTPWRMDHLDMRSPSGYRVLRISGFETAADIESITTLANHADALVALVEAVERIRELRQDGLHSTMEYVDIMLSRLADIHAVRSTP